MAILEAENIIKQYKSHDSVVTAVNRASLSVEDGEFVAIMGASGSGKSTFLHICAGLDIPNSGTVTIRGQCITSMNADEKARFRGIYTGIVFQKHNLIPQLTVLENIMIPTVMGDRPASAFEEHLKKLVHILGLEDRLNHLPSEISGGQQQRCAIARALINRPQVLFCDEPTGNLDRANADEVLDLLLKTKETIGQTIIMVTHDIQIAEQADRVFVMENGVLIPKKKTNLSN